MPIRRMIRHVDSPPASPPSPPSPSRSDSAASTEDDFPGCPGILIPGSAYRRWGSEQDLWTALDRVQCTVVNAVGPHRPRERPFWMWIASNSMCEHCTYFKPPDSGRPWLWGSPSLLAEKQQLRCIDVIPPPDIARDVERDALRNIIVPVLVFDLPSVPLQNVSVYTTSVFKRMRVC
jgi:hypothetical protein